MKFLTSIFLISTYLFSNEVKEVVMRDGLVYEKFTNIPFNGRGIMKEEDKTIKLIAKNGLINGVAEVYGINGNLKSSITFVNSIKNGILIEYDKYGEIQSKVIYKKNLPCDGWEKNRFGIMNYKKCKKDGVEWDYINGDHYKVIWVNGTRTEEIKQN